MRIALHHLRAHPIARVDGHQEQRRKGSLDRDKLLRSLTIALRKRPVEGERIERLVNSIQRRLETLGENEIPTKVVGEMVMDQLKELDPVAYVRFASVYRNFREAKDFEEFVGKLGDSR